MSAEGTARAVKPWSSFQCTGIHHAVRARTYKGDEHLAYALNKSMAPLPLPIAGVPKTGATGQKWPAEGLKVARGDLLKKFKRYVFLRC